MLYDLLELVASIPNKPFLIFGYVLLVSAFTVRVFQSWHYLKFSINDWDTHDKVVVAVGTCFSVLSCGLPCIFLLAEIRSRKSKQKIIASFSAHGSVIRVPETMWNLYEPSGTIRGSCPWMITPIGELEQHGFFVEPTDDSSVMGFPTNPQPIKVIGGAGKLALKEVEPGLFVSETWPPEITTTVTSTALKRIKN